ncbi:flagellar basal body distal rod protein - FlgG [Nitrospirillum viridazoti Y2]|uniref:Flagellar basal-body rod protein FlgG n=1 Tax=Nitrospirillum amazonense TaxID=28077 RepID=A0A560J3Z9_9PROT|nr:MULTISPECIES: flagellar basal-body rod protein FlgG [Nitrospirillum]EGY01434.1 flagellar basal body distal rod protein - FlgG [Nitrospirillum amazonense Y2]MEA1676570.1 flagellar basal-body rod protein FlgG [Nitrospirillum sp. BR 11163]TWB63330.1 flagellar basal-body rod protein FlgG [Nitrospirillum amazonense]
MRSLSIAATGMQAQQTNVEVISNNIANMTTTGFKRQRAEFQDLLYQNMRRVGSNSSDAGTIVPTGIQIGAGVKTAAVYRINEQGNITTTGNSLDLAINGNGFFQVTLPSGQIAYTRAGSFSLNANSQVVTSDGYLLNPGFTLPQNAVDISVDASGQVQAKIDGQVNPAIVGQLTLANFPNAAGLEAIGDNLLLETPASGQPVTAVPGSTGFGRITQNALETSNVNVVTEITNLIQAQRAYEMNSRVVTTTDQMLQSITNMK